jgi:hypothetical protein
VLRGCVNPSPGLRRTTFRPNSAPPRRLTLYHCSRTVEIPGNRAVWARRRISGFFVDTRALFPNDIWMVTCAGVRHHENTTHQYYLHARISSSQPKHRLLLKHKKMQFVYPGHFPTITSGGPGIGEFAITRIVSFDWAKLRRTVTKWSARFASFASKATDYSVEDARGIDIHVALS